MRYPKIKILTAAVSCAVAVSAANVSAQEPFVIEEVLVTAQKRTQSSQDIPLAVQALSADVLAQNGITTLSDLSSISPGFKFADTQGTNNVSALRGVNSFAFGFGLEESIPFYLDGVYLGNGFDMLGELLDVERVEVLKGPQGTLFGRNASGGAVSVITKKPTNEFEAEVGGGAGNFGLVTTRAVINVPLIDNVLAVRAGFSSRDRDGWQTNVITGQEDGFAQDRKNGFLRALWSVNESLELEYSGDWSRQQDHSGYRTINTVRPGSPLFQGLWGQANPVSFYNEDSIDQAAAGDRAPLISLAGGAIIAPLAPAGSIPEIIQDRKISGNALKANWDVNSDLVFSSITSYRTVETIVGADADGGDLGLANSFQTGETKELNQEFRLNGVSESLDWLAGVNYYKQERDASITTYLSSLIALQRLGLAGLRTAVTETSAGENETESYSAFADATWHLTDRFNLTAGLRYTRDEKTFTLIDAGNDSFNGQGLIYPNIDQLADPSVSSWDDTWTDVSGRLAVDYAYSDDVMIFASISQGYKSGGFNTRLTVEGNPVQGFISPEFATEPFDEETNLNYEVGIKSDLLDGRLRFNSSVFYYVYEDLQVLLADGNSPVARTVNASEVTGYGWDNEITYLAAPGLSFSFNALLLDAEYTEDVIDNTGVLRILEGAERPWAPKWAYTFAADYSVDMGDVGEFRANFTYAHQDDQFMRATQVTQSYSDEDNTQEAYGILNGRLSFYSANDHWELGLWGKNILDEAYRNNLIASSDSVAGILMAFPGEPRTFGLEAVYRF